MGYLVVVGIILLLVGITLGIWEKRRKFYRTNVAGVEQFKTFTAKVRGTFFDGVLRLLAYSLMIGGVVSIAFVYQDSWGVFILLPFLLLMLFLTFMLS